MNSFYFALWIRWCAVFALLVLLGAGGFATLLTLIVYGVKGFPSPDPSTWEALRTIWRFWAGIGYGVGMILGLAAALRPLLMRCITGRRIVVLDCQGHSADRMGARLYFRIWRRWFFGVIWISVMQVVGVIVGHKLLFGGAVWMGWYTPWWLTPIIAVSALFAVPVWLYRCSKVRIEPCVS